MPPDSASLSSSSPQGVRVLEVPVQMRKNRIDSSLERIFCRFRALDCGIEGKLHIGKACQTVFFGIDAMRWRTDRFEARSSLFHNDRGGSRRNLQHACRGPGVGLLRSGHHEPARVR
jgi:hypothetical protein